MDVVDIGANKYWSLLLTFPLSYSIFDPRLCVPPRPQSPVYRLLRIARSITHVGVGYEIAVEHGGGPGYLVLRREYGALYAWPLDCSTMSLTRALPTYL